MASSIDIANRAITKLGDARITSLSDNTTAARAMKNMYDIARKALIRRAMWNFAKTRVELAASADAPVYGWKYKYQVPNDFLRLLQVNDFVHALGFNYARVRDDAPYEFEGGFILTNYGAPLKIRYLRDVTDPTKYDSCFVEAYASQLAFEACETITQSNTKKDELAKEVAMWIREGIKANEVENPPQGFYDDSWILSRY